MKISTKFQPSCDAMMQELAEASVESILTGIDTPECPVAAPETPPTSHSHKEGGPHEWYTPSAMHTPFTRQPAWSFCESETASSHFRSSSQRQVSSSMYGSSEGCSSQAADGVPPGCTTVMLRNIPNKYTRSGLLTALVERGFDPSIDCNNLYLPMDAGSGCNLGYAFLNFTSHEKAMSFMKQFDGCRLPSAGSRKVCSVVWANKQGLFQHSNPPTVKEQTTPGTSTTMAPVAEGIPTCKIFVGGLPITTTEADLVEYFSKFGHVQEASIVVNRQTGASRGFGFCEFVSPDAVDRVQFAQARRPHSINCRIVSVRPYTMHQFAGTGCLESQLMHLNHQMTEAPMQGTMTFLMGNGMIHYPAGNAGMVSTAAYGAPSGGYSHPMLSPPVTGEMNMGHPFMNQRSPQLHQNSFISY